MASPQVPILVLGTVAIALFAGGTIAKLGSVMLDKRQFDELKAMGPDPVAVGAPLVMAAAAYFGTQYPWPMVTLVIAVAFAVLYRVPYRMWHSSWPLAARLRLVIGNVVLCVGCMSAALIYIAQRLGPAAL